MTLARFTEETKVTTTFTHTGFYKFSSDTTQQEMFLFVLAHSDKFMKKVHNFKDAGAVVIFYSAVPNIIS
ncbi:hypothetical protein GW935_03015 [Candidatus Falkowbacteria bacterium]|nr:hypothetical protein [Candidatus Falkowbacteria bacterium]